MLIVTRSLSVANFFGNKEQKEKDNFFLRTDLSEKCINGLSEPDRGGMKVKKILFFLTKKPNIFWVKIKEPLCHLNMCLYLRKNSQIISSFDLCSSWHFLVQCVSLPKLSLVQVNKWSLHWSFKPLTFQTWAWWLLNWNCWGCKKVKPIQYLDWITY